MSRFWKVLLSVMVIALVMLLGVGVAAYEWLNTPLRLIAPSVEVVIPPGASARTVANEVRVAGVDTSSDVLYVWFVLSGKARHIKAGHYEFIQGITPRSLLNKLVLGQEVKRFVTLVEGWNIRQVRQALERNPDLKHDTRTLSDEELMVQLGRAGQAAEGSFFPDTYAYTKAGSDLEVLRRAMQAMDKHLEAAWSARDPGVPLRTPQELLILASIVEKESAVEADRSLIAAVFLNRLRKGMLLQTDPTVIYGMGEKFDGNLRKRDLQTDTPWNTYTRTGLPPTPIAMPGKAALMAVVQPAKTQALYFVARGDGSSHFSETLDEHNRAVRRYQLQPPSRP